MDKGAHFHRCDFQVHTPRDCDWTGGRPLDDEGRKAYAAELIAACRVAALDAIAITDHHDLSFFPFVRAAAEEEVNAAGERLGPEQRLVVFPGMELTLAVPCQALLILDADLPQDRLSVLTEALAIEPVPLDQPLGAVQRLEIHTFSHLYEELDKREWLRGKYIVLPNVSEGGSSTLLRSGMANKYKEMPCVGAYVDGLVSKLGKGNAKIVAGDDPNYGSKRVAIFQTSDSRTRDHAALGGAASWVKWATPTAEALRQACLAQETRLSQSEPLLPSSYISRLTVSNSQFLGPVDLELSHQYNAVIGGRGTGKSTILEYLRWALCDQVSPTPLEDGGTDQALRRERLVQATLRSIPEAVVEVHFVVNELAHVVRREAASGQITLKVGDQDFRKVGEADVRSVIPIQAYSQKQLSGVAVRVDELTRFVTTPVQAQLQELEDELSATASAIRETYARLERQRQLQAGIRRDELTVASLREQGDKLREGVTGVSPEDQELLAKRSRYETSRQIFEGYERTVTRSTEEAAQLREFLGRLFEDVAEPLEEEVVEHESLEEMRRVLHGTLGTAIDDISKIEASFASLSELPSPFAKARSRWTDEAEKFASAYEAASARWTEHEQRLKELAGVEERQRSLGDSLAVARDELRDLGDPEGAYADQRQTWLSLRGRHRSIVAAECKRLTELSDGLINASVEAGSSANELGEALKLAIARSGVRAARIDAVAEALRERSDPLADWELALSELELLALHDPNEAGSTLPDTAILMGLGLPTADIQRIAGRLSVDAWLELSLLQLADKPLFTYRSREDRYIPFENASAGQQATALLHVLLRQAGPPLVIDQPEDDLDNEVILEVAEQLWDAKTHRQLIFASHNANLVVNGDADLVVCCEYRVAGDHSGGRLAHEGAIDVQRVRKVITRVMEGGEKAFKLRTAKYGF
jgi:chromosome segregation protein